MLMEQEEVSKFEQWLQDEKNWSFDRAVEVCRYLEEFIEEKKV